MSDDKEKELDPKAQPEESGSEVAAEAKPEQSVSENAAEAQPAAAAPVSEPAAAPAASEPAAAPTAPAAAEQAAVDPEREAKLKAAAEARAARAAAKAAAEGEGGSAAPAGDVDAEKAAKIKAAEEARAARAAAKAAAESEAVPAEPKPPSPKQPQLDEAAALIRSVIADDAIVEAYINEINGHMPTLVIRTDRLLESAELLKSHETQQFDYLRNLSGVDYETHLETVYHLVSLQSKREMTVKVKTDRDNPQIPSVVPIWNTANWNEREVYDLLGIDFPGHPDLRRIMMPDDWVGYPLRKDYEPLDPEV